MKIERLRNMNKKEAWKKFQKSGKIEDYLIYKEIERNEKKFKTNMNYFFLP